MIKLRNILPISFLVFQSSAFASLISDSPEHGIAEHDAFNAYEGSVWQRLGQSSLVDDGVLWRTNDLADYANEAVFVGDIVSFQFEFWTAGWGTHSFDQIAVWADIDHQDGFELDESLLYEQRVKATNEKGLQYNNTNADFSYYNIDLTITEELLDGFWLRTRVHCADFGLIENSPYGYLNQGEVEDWFVPVNNTPVPEPQTVGLFSLALLFFIRRKNNE